MTQFTQAPIFDADQHMYETPESLTKYLPEKYSRAVQFAQIGRQTRIVINNRVNDFIPNPTFERVASPGAHEKFFAGGSDYPHPEGLAEPKGFWKYAEGMDERRTYDFMGDNARRFMGLPIANPDTDAVKPPVLASA